MLHGDIGTVQGHKPILDERFLSGPTEDKSGPLLDDWRQFFIVIQGDNGIEVAEQWIAQVDRLDISWRDDALALDSDRKGTNRIGHRTICAHDGDGLRHRSDGVDDIELIFFFDGDCFRMIFEIQKPLGHRPQAVGWDDQHMGKRLIAQGPIDA